MPELLLPRLKREIEARLAELRPAVEEAEQLEAAKQALLEERAQRPRHRISVVPELDDAQPARPRPVVAPAPEEPAPSGNPTRDAILALVEERPGVSVAEIVAVTKLAKPSVAATVSKLKREGVLADEAGGVKLASRKPLTLSQVAGGGTRDDGASDAEWDAARPRRGGGTAA